MVALLRLLEVTPSLYSVTRKFKVVSSICVAGYPSLNYFTNSSYLYSLVYSTFIASMVLVYSFGVCSLLFMQKVNIY